MLFKCLISEYYKAICNIFAEKSYQVEYGMVGPNGGELTVKAVDREAVATFPVQEQILFFFTLQIILYNIM